jgi:DNA polymerase-1
VWADKQKLIRVLTAMKRRGIRVDTKLAERELAIGKAEMQRILDELGYVNLGPKAMTDLFLFKLGLPVVRRTPSGSPSFAKDAMEIYDHMLERIDSPEAKTVRVYRGWQKSTSASFKPYLDLVDNDGRVRPTFHTHRVTTGRLSCSEPNCQQISKDGGKPWNQHVKECFIAKPGYILLSADYSQLELRLATAYADEEMLKRVFEEGRDIFSEMGAQLHMDRDSTKRLVYTLQYGGGEKRLMNVFGVSQEVARQIKNNFWNTYPRFRALNEGCAAKVKREGRLRLWTGRWRTFEYSSQSYKAMNSLIQGGAADIMEHVMVRVFEELDNEECELLLQVHDELVFEVKEDREEEYRESIKTIMEDIDGALPEEMRGAFKVKFNVETKIWGQ